MLAKELKFFINCFVAELQLQQLEVPEVVFVGMKTGKFKFITVESRIYRISAVDEHKPGILNIQIDLFTKT